MAGGQIRLCRSWEVFLSQKGQTPQYELFPGSILGEDAKILFNSEVHANFLWFSVYRQNTGGAYKVHELYETGKPKTTGL